MNFLKSEIKDIIELPELYRYLLIEENGRYIAFDKNKVVITIGYIISRLENETLFYLDTRKIKSKEVILQEVENPKDIIDNIKSRFNSDKMKTDKLCSFNTKAKQIKLFTEHYNRKKKSAELKVKELKKYNKDKKLNSTQVPNILKENLPKLELYINILHNDIEIVSDVSYNYNISYTIEENINELISYKIYQEFTEYFSNSDYEINVFEYYLELIDLNRDLTTYLLYKNNKPETRTIKFK